MSDSPPNKRTPTLKELALLDWLKRYGYRQVGEKLQKVEEAVMYGTTVVTDEVKEACRTLRNVAQLVGDIE